MKIEVRLIATEDLLRDDPDGWGEYLHTVWGEPLSKGDPQKCFTCDHVFKAADMPPPLFVIYGPKNEVWTAEAQCWRCVKQPDAFKLVEIEVQKFWPKGKLVWLDPFHRIERTK
jgi:hypothetical protein